MANVSLMAAAMLFEVGSPVAGPFASSWRVLGRRAQGRWLRRQTTGPHKQSLKNALGQSTHALFPTIMMITMKMMVVVMVLMRMVIEMKC